MKWRKMDDYYLESDAGYTVSRVKVAGEVFYEAWHKQVMFAARLKTSQEAKDLCEQRERGLRGSQMQR